MTAALAPLRRRLGALWRHEDGTATIEFVFAVPIVLMIFMASIEAGFYMIKQVMVERGLDIVMRDFRLGRLASLTHDQIRDRVCAVTVAVPDCTAQLKVWIEPLDTAALVAPNAYCGDRNGTLTTQTTGSIAHGSPDQIMYVRVCTLQDPIFPSTGIGLRLRADSLGHGYEIAATTLVVNEP